MNKIYLTIPFLCIALVSKGQLPAGIEFADKSYIHANSLEQLINAQPSSPSTARYMGSGNATCATATTLTVGNTFTCNSFSSNPNASAFPNACVTTTGSGIQRFRTDWYCFNSGSNKTLAVVMRNVVNSTSFTPAMAVFGPYTSCASGCAGAMSGPLCDNGLSFPYYDSIKILENISQNKIYLIAIVERRSSLDITFGGFVSYCISVQPTNLDDCEVLPTGCPVTCGNLCVFEQSSAPSVASVVASCTQKTYSHRIQGWNVTSPEDSVEFCYNFQVDSSCTMRFGGVITASGCGIGNLSSANWRIYNATTCTVPYSGTSVPPSAAVTTPGSYIFCMKYSAACDLHFGTYYYGYGTCVVQQPVLPIELSSFIAVNEKDGIGLLWQTLSEVNNDHYEIEKSADGIIFEGIGTVNSQAASGNSKKELNYYFKDHSPYKGLNYYRLKQVDIDGRFSYSKIVVAHNKYDKFHVLGFLPAQMTSDAVLMFEDDIQDHIQVSIFNAVGKLMNKELIESMAGLNSYNIPLSLAGDAMYIIQLRKNNNELVSVKYVKLK